MKHCSKCQEEKPDTAFYPNRARYDGLTSYCKDCSNSYAASWKKANPARVAVHTRKAGLRYLYGITLEHYDNLFAVQDGRCAICGTDSPGGIGRFHVDHDHISGNVRGLLCNNCNIGIGCLQDSPDVLRSAAKYLEEFALNATRNTEGTIDGDDGS